MKDQQDIIEELFELLDPYIDVNSGYDDAVYGNYCEWQSLDSYCDETLNNILDIYCDMLPKRKPKTRDKIIAFLREQGVPEKTAFEPEPNFPNSQSYWRSDEDTYLYEEYFLPLDEFISDVKLLQDKIKNENDDLIKKALLLAIFSLTESYVAQKIWKLIPDIEKNVGDVQLQSILRAKIESSLREPRGRKDLYKQFAQKELIDIPHKNLRNILAHSIKKPLVVCDKIEYEYKKQKKAVSFDEIIEKIAAYIEEL